MLELIFNNIGYFYTLAFVVAVVGCILVKTPISFCSAVFLGALAYPAWNMDLWQNPINMSVYHLGILTLMTFCLHGRHGMVLFYLTFTMLLADCFWAFDLTTLFSANYYQFPYSNFWWQSVLNLLFLSQCIITIKGCYDTHKVNRYQRRLKHDAFMSFESDKIAI